MSEHEIQRNFFNWVLRNRKNSLNPELRNAMELCYSNQTGMPTNGYQAQKAKIEGMTAGIPDVNLDWPKFQRVGLGARKEGPIYMVDSGLRLEFKYRKHPVSTDTQKKIDGGRYLIDLKPEQKKKRLLLIKVGYIYRVVYSVSQAISEVMEYLPFDKEDYIKPKYL